MKRKVTKLVLIFIILSIPLSFLLYVFTYNHSIEKNKELSLNYIKELLIEPSGDYDKENENRILDRMSAVDSSVYKSMVEKNIKIRLVNSNFKEDKFLRETIEIRNNEGMKQLKEAFNFSMEDLMGIYFPKEFVAIRVDTETYGTEIHEIGHTVDDLLGWVSNKDEFKKVMVEEQNKVLRHDYFTTSSEYFAEVFSYYYRGETTRKELKKNAPKTYEFIQELMKSSI